MSDYFDDYDTEESHSWADPYGNRYDQETLALERPQRACRICRRTELTLTACYDLAGTAGRAWLYTCPASACAREHIYLPRRGLFALERADADDTEIDGTPVPLKAAGDPL